MIDKKVQTRALLNKLMKEELPPSGSRYAYGTLLDDYTRRIHEVYTKEWILSLTDEVKLITCQPRALQDIVRTVKGNIDLLLISIVTILCVGMVIGLIVGGGR